MEWRKTRFDFYEVSDEGLVRSVDRVVNSKGGGTRLCKGRILKQVQDKDGYYTVCIHDRGRQFPMFVHRLVAEAFIPNVEKLPIIHHINGNNQDNNVSNLMWATILFNNSEDIAKKRKSEAAYKRADNKVKIRQYSLDGKFIKEFKSSMDIQRELGFDRSSVTRVCQGKQKTSYGFKWVYLD